MEDYTLSEIRLGDKRGIAELDRLLAKEKIKRDAHLDYIVGLYDDYGLVASGACFADTLRCLAVDGAHQGEGLLNRVVSHLVDYQMRRGHSHLFIYTKTDKTRFFADLGFYEIARVDGRAAFMENRRNGFSSYLERLSGQKRDGESAALVMNCNPFTLGHRYLVEQAALRNDVVHLFAVSEDASLFPFADRYAMIEAGCADLKNVVLHRTESYMISSAVFPSYFLKDEQSAIEVQARLDIALFGKIAAVLGVRRRYVGEEPFSSVTRIYNETMLRELPAAGIELVVVPRREIGGEPVSASRVRQMIHDGRLDEIRPLVPQSTFDYFGTEAGLRIVRRIQAASEVVHY